MKEVTTYVGIDAHKKDLFVAMLIGAAPVPVTWQLANEPGAVRRMVRKLERAAPGPVRVFYEAGPCGYLRPAVDAGLRAQIPFSGCRGLSHSGSHRWIPGVKWTDACRPAMRAGVAVTSHAGLMTAASTKSPKSIEQARGGYTCCGG